MTFCDWITRENGWQLRFADSAVEEKSRTTILHGSIKGLTPGEALAAVLPTSGVEHQLEKGVLLIRLAAEGTKNSCFGSTFLSGCSTGRSADRRRFALRLAQTPRASRLELRDQKDGDSTTPLWICKGAD